MQEVPNYRGGGLVGLYEFNGINQRVHVWRRQSLKPPGCQDQFEHATKDPGPSDVPVTTDSHTYDEMLFMETTCNTLMSHSVVIREGKATASLRKRDEWKKLWHRQHSRPVSRSLASPATPLVLRPRHAFARPLLFTYSERRGARYVSDHRSALRSDLDCAKRSNFRAPQSKNAWRRIGQVDKFVEQLMLHQHDKDEVSKASERRGRAFAMDTGQLEETGRRGRGDRVAVGGGRLVLDGSLKTQPGGFLEGRHHPMHEVQGHLSRNSLLTRYPFATKPCGLSNVLQRFQAPILNPLRQPPVAERSRENKAAYGEQIQQKCHRVEQSSCRAEP
ncbi:hypothetical protein BJV78DRAFT_1151768 [Lactifluus subvellereus]|nr:hypothetical protein BJV78DRAFT_1151768 [Lactifluus subvellereus]